MSTNRPYLKPGRLADVLAALQIMAAGQRPEGTIDKWAEELSRDHGKEQIARWTAVFTDHPEFFLVYNLGNAQLPPKAALRWRYTNKRFDPKTDKEYTQELKELLPRSEQEFLTTKPLGGESISVLLNTAIELHSRQMAEQEASRWLVSPLLSLLGAVLGGIVGANWGS